MPRVPAFPDPSDTYAKPAWQVYDMARYRVAQHGPLDYARDCATGGISSWLIHPRRVCRFELMSKPLKKKALTGAAGAEGDEQQEVGAPVVNRGGTRAAEHLVAFLMDRLPAVRCAIHYLQSCTSYQDNRYVRPPMMGHVDA